LTIVNAAATTANDPIPDVESESASRTALLILQIGRNLQLAAITSLVWGEVLRSKWDSTGWTFHEKIPSKRLLVVTECLAFFRCPTLLWREDRFEEPHRVIVSVDKRMNVEALHRQSHRDRRSAQPARKVLGLQGRSRSLEPVSKSLEDYGSLVAMYVNRQFTNAGDALLTLRASSRP
jgi:hypothetical protein